VATYDERVAHDVDLADLDFQFQLPDLLASETGRLEQTGVWMSGASPAQSALLAVPHSGCYMRCLLPVNLTDGRTVTFGVWLRVSSDDLELVDEVWHTPRYGALTLRGKLANDVPPWGAKDSDFQIAVIEPSRLPRCIASEDRLAASMLADQWEPELVLPRASGDDESHHPPAR
jgi:hypothetical protein